MATCLMCLCVFEREREREREDEEITLRLLYNASLERDSYSYTFDRQTKPIANHSGISLLPDTRCSWRESRSGVLHHVHLKIRLVGGSIGTERALVRRLFTAFVYHVSPEVLHLMVTAIAIVTRESTLSARPSSILGHSTHVEPHFRVICNQEEIIWLIF